MAVFLITLAQGPSSAMEETIQYNYPENNCRVSELAWLIEDKEAITPQNVDNKLLGRTPPPPPGSTSSSPSKRTVNPQDLGAYLIPSFSGYWGYHNNSVWEWLQLRGL